jgi:hypothetical protein
VLQHFLTPEVMPDNRSGFYLIFHSLIFQYQKFRNT